MGRVNKLDRLVLKYLKKTGRRKTLIIMMKSLERKPVKLSFAIQKAPERKIVESLQVKKERKKNSKDSERENKIVTVPEKFKQLAKKFGLPEEHLQFFYENRESFQWEAKDKTDIHCTEKTCKFVMKASKGCLIDHMISVHKYHDIPCDKPDCSFVAYSQKNLNLHTGSFHGHGRRPDSANAACPFPSCNAFFANDLNLQTHINIHENRMFFCSYCPFRTSEARKLTIHLDIHFNIKKYVCDVCSRPFFRQQTLNIHVQAFHERPDYFCKDCGFNTSKRYAFNIHRTSCKERLKHSQIL